MTIEYITIASAGNAIDFGNLNECKEEMGGTVQVLQEDYLDGVAEPSTN